MWYLEPDRAPKQARSVAESTARMNYWSGSVRSGKTVGSLIRWVEYVCDLIERGVPGRLLMFGKTERTLERNILEPLEQFLTPKRYRKVGPYAYICGRKIDLAGANDERAEGKIRGSTYLGAYGDELTLVPQSFFRMLLSRLSEPGAKLFGTTNPDSPYHWLKTEYLDRADELNLHSWHFTLDDNPYLDTDYVDSLKREYTGLWYKRFILGLWVQAAGAVYDMWDEDVHVAQCEDDPGRHIVGVDYGTSNPCVFLHVGLHGPRAHVLRERYYDGRGMRQKTDSEHAADLGRFLEGVPGRPIVYVDPSAASFIAECRSRRISVRAADNSVIDGIRFVASMLSSGRLHVEPGCSQTRQEFGSYIWDERAQKKGEDKPLKQHDHAMDALRYALYTHLGRPTTPVRTATITY